MESKDGEQIEEMVPKDEAEKRNGPVSILFLILFYLLGATCFVPNSYYITANEYWMYKFRNPDFPFNKSESEKTVLQQKFTAYTSMVGSIGMIVVMLATFAVLKKVSLQKRIVGSMLLMLVLFAITLMFIFLDTDSWQTGYFVIAVGTSGFFSACTAVLLVSLFELSARFPPRCLAAQVAGQSVCGILAAAVQILALLAAPSVKGTACLYYAIATAMIATTLTTYLIVWKQSEYFRNKLEFDPNEKGGNAEEKFDIDLIKRVLKKVALLLTSLTVCVFATQMVHPGLTALIESSGKGSSTWSDTYFLPVCVFLLFSTMEFIGRELCNHIPFIKKKFIIFGTSLIRVVLLPLLLFCNLQPKNHIPVAFHNDTYFIIFMILLAFSGGYVQNAVIVVIPDYCTPEEKGTSMFAIMLIMVIFMTAGSVLSGVIVSYI